MVRAFKDFPELSEYLARAVAEKIDGASLGFSNQSCSAYVSRADFKLRFSDHDDRYDANETIRFDGFTTELRDEFDDYDGIEIDQHHIEALVARGIAAFGAAAEGWIKRDGRAQKP